MEVFIFIVLLLFALPYIVRLVIRFAAPYIIKKMFPANLDKFYEQHAHHFQEEKPHGTVTVEQNKRNNNKKKFDGKGEYVDFEEIKD